MRYSKSMIEAVKQVGLYEQFDYVVLDKDNKIIARQKNKQDAKEFEKFANSQQKYDNGKKVGQKTI